MPYTDEQYERYCETVANDIAYASSEEDLASAKHFFASIHMKITDYEITWGWGRSWITVGFDSDIPSYCLWVPDELPDGDSNGYFISEGCVERWREHKSELESLASVTSDILDKMDAVEYLSDEYYSLEAMAWGANDALIAKWEEIAQEIADIVADEIQSECESVYEREYFEEWADANEWSVEASLDKRAYDIQGIIDDIYDATRDISMVELYDYYVGQTMLKLVFEVDGDWKHDHILFDHLVSDMLDKKGIDYTITNGDVLDDTGGDWYNGTHNVFIMKDSKNAKKTAYVDESIVREIVQNAHGMYRSDDNEVNFDSFGNVCESPWDYDSWDNDVKPWADGLYISMRASEPGGDGVIQLGAEANRFNNGSFDMEVDHLFVASDDEEEIVAKAMDWLRQNRVASKKRSK